MLKNRLFLNGLGIGLIIGAVMLKLVFMVNNMETQSQSQGQDRKEMNAEVLKEYARNYGLTIISKDEQMFTKEQLEAANQKAADEVKSKLEKQNVESSQLSPRKKGILIKQGLNSSEVASQLFDFGIIKDQKKFIELMTLQKLNGLIQFGYYEFEDPLDVQEVIKKITAPQ